MNSILTFGILILVSSIIFGGITNDIYAQEDLSILSKIAKRAQDQIQNQINVDSSDKIKQLFNKGSQNIELLENAIRNEDGISAKENFLSAMKIFAEISRLLSNQESNSNNLNDEHVSIDLQRLQSYVKTLKLLAKNHDVSFDFSILDKLFIQAQEQINNKQYKLSLETIKEIKSIIVKVKQELKEEASNHESQRAKEYALKYLEQIDRLIEYAKQQNYDQEIIEKLSNAKENLILAENPSEIIKEIRNVMSLKVEYQLTNNDMIESRLLQIEKTISELSNNGNIEYDDIQRAKQTLEIIKHHLNNGEFNLANDLIKNLLERLHTIKNSH